MNYGKISRRDLLKTSCATGALISLAGADLFAAAQAQFTPLRLSPQGQQQVNPQVSALDSHEEGLLDDLLGGGGQPQLHQDVNSLDQDINNILANPGSPDNYNPNQFNQDGAQIHNQLMGYMPPNISLGRAQVTIIIRQIDGFVGHWYPCNDILEVGSCQTKIWHTFGLGNMAAIDLYMEHLFYEMDFMFRFHPAGGQFGQHCTALMGRVRNCRGMIYQDPQACRAEFMTITSATSLVYRKYYPQYC